MIFELLKEAQIKILINYSYRISRCISNNKIINNIKKINK